MKQLLRTLLLCLTLLLAFQVDGRASTPQVKDSLACTQPQDTALQPVKDRSDRLRNTLQPQQDEGQAMLSNSENRYRLSVSRPSRIVPQQSPRWENPDGRQPETLKSKNKPQLFYGGKYRLETAPFQSSAACDYYVFALRRLLC